VRLAIVGRLLVVGIIGCAACAKSGGNPAVDAPEVISDPDSGSGSNTASPCPAGQFASSIDHAGVVTCAGLEAATATAIDSRCSVLMGWHDSCNGCTDAPTKWGAAAPSTCTAGVGGNTCTSPMLVDANVDLLGIGLDGDVNGDDVLYATLHCVTATRAPAPAPCQAGWAITGKLGDTWTCSPLAEAAVGAIRNHCSVYLGWQDGCDGCVTPPAKWGYANDGGCHNGTGVDDTCTVATLGTDTVHLFGLNFDGDVDGNDKFHVGMHCDVPAPAGGPSHTTCPVGQFVVGANPDGSFQCGDPAPLAAKYFGDHCTLYFGWHDTCDGCLDAPTKWGSVKTGVCANGAGADDTCTEFSLGGTMVQMFGLSPDGNVNGDDTVYVGLRCQ
jgi:hypothetical protein